MHFEPSRQANWFALQGGGASTWTSWMQKMRERRVKERCCAITNPTQPNLDKLKPNFYDLVTSNLLAKGERELESIINLNLATGEERRNWVQMKKREAPGEEEGRVTMQLRPPWSNQLRRSCSNQLRLPCSNYLRLRDRYC